MIYSTTPNIEGKRIVTYHGVIAGEAIVGVNIFKDLFASVRDIVGGRTASYEKELESARQAAMQDITAKAEELQGNAIVGIDIDYEVIGSGNGNMLMVSVTGTAVTLN